MNRTVKFLVFGFPGGVYILYNPYKNYPGACIHAQAVCPGKRLNQKSFSGHENCFKNLGHSVLMHS